MLVVVNIGLGIWVDEMELGNVIFKVLLGNLVGDYIVIFVWILLDVLV